MLSPLLPSRWPRREELRRNARQPAEGKSSSFLVYSTVPFNGGPTLPELGADIITPTEQFFCRNHGSIPVIRRQDYRLRIVARRTVQFTLDRLLGRFRTIELPATLECAGNRRSEFFSVGAMSGEIPWMANGIGTAVWSGIPLLDVLESCGIPPRFDGHVSALGTDVINRQQNIYFGGSVSMATLRTVGQRGLLAYAMNGQPLTAVHGAPLRLIIPGVIGARSIKWVWNIALTDGPSENFFQQHSYRLFPPDVTATTAHPDRGCMMERLSLNSAFVFPVDGAFVPAGIVSCRGYAIAAGGQRVSNVEVSCDQGTTWQSANIVSPHLPGTWVFWKHDIRMRTGTHTLMVRATDTAGNQQARHVRDIWNYRGYNNTSYHRIMVTTR